MPYIGTGVQDPNYFASEPGSIELEGGTYNQDRLYNSSTATVTGNITLTNNLVLARITDKGNNVTLTSDGTTRTITGSGKIESGNIVTTNPGNFTGMTGTIGSDVVTTNITKLGTVTAGTLGSNVVFPAGHTLSWTSYLETNTSLTLVALNTSGNNWIAAGGTIRSATVLAGNKLWIIMTGGFVKHNGSGTESQAGFYYTTDGSDPASVAQGSSEPSTLITNGLGVSSNNALSYRGVGSVQYLYENSTGSSVTVKFSPVLRNQGANTATLYSTAQNTINFTVVSIQG